jgi:hypothetical protein
MHRTISWKIIKQIILYNAIKTSFENTKYNYSVKVFGTKCYDNINIEYVVKNIKNMEIVLNNYENKIIISVNYGLGSGWFNEILCIRMNQEFELLDIITESQIKLKLIN